MCKGIIEGVHSIFLHYKFVSRESCSRSTQKYYTWGSINDYHKRKINILVPYLKKLAKFVIRKCKHGCYFIGLSNQPKPEPLPRDCTEPTMS